MTKYRIRENSFIAIFLEFFTIGLGLGALYLLLLLIQSKFSIKKIRQNLIFAEFPTKSFLD